MTPWRLLILAALALLAGSGCAFNVNLNANRLDSPETRGEKFRPTAEAAVVGSNTLLPDTGSWDRSWASFRAAASLGILERLDLALKTPVNAPWLLQAKYQLLGEPQAHASSGNFALAVTLGAGLTQLAGDSQNHVNATTYDLAVIAGKRFLETWMIYGGAFTTACIYSGVTTPAGAPGGNELRGSASQSGVNLGVQLDAVVGSIKIEEAWTSATVAYGPTQDELYTGASVSVRF